MSLSRDHFHRHSPLVHAHKLCKCQLEYFLNCLMLLERERTRRKSKKKRQT